jgi:hypothetical protein
MPFVQTRQTGFLDEPPIDGGFARVAPYSFGSTLGSRFRCTGEVWESEDAKCNGSRDLLAAGFSTDVLL